MEIIIKNHQKKVKLHPSQIKKILQALLLKNNIKNVELSIVFVTHQKMRAFNFKYLQKNAATDVLAFDMKESQTKNHLSEASPALTGDIIISTDAVIQNAKKYGTTQEKELFLYVIHGVLHLLGYDDHGPKKTKQMRNKEEEWLKDAFDLG